uniref:SRR1-like domain-containing protein n=1 Tax=Mycena chlorophos TaxID=658473 RepID=A0ABQ0LXD0_MYCCL|nr:predicted protein [Mycena chlorophos]
MRLPNCQKAGRLTLTAPGATKNALRTLSGRGTWSIYAVMRLILATPLARFATDKIAYFHASADWDEHWLREPSFQLSADSELLSALNSRQVSLIQSSLSKIGRAYDDMKSSGYLDRLAAFFGDVFSSSSAPPRPMSAFGAGFSGYDRLDADGYDRAGYTMAEGHSSTDWEARTHYQVAYFVGLGRIFRIPAGHMIAYDPCYSIVDIVILATLGIRGLTRTDTARPFLRIFTVPTLFYAPGAEQDTVGDAILRTPDSSNLLLDVGDVTWCLEPHEAVDGSGESYEGYPHDLIAAYVLSYKKVAIPAHRIEMKPGEAPEAPAGEHHMLQWIPAAQREAFEKRRGPAREPDIRMLGAYRVTSLASVRQEPYKRDIFVELALIPYTLYRRMRNTMLPVHNLNPVQPAQAPWADRVNDLWKASAVMGTIGLAAGSIGGAIPRAVEATILHRSSSFPLGAYQLIRFGALSTGLGLGLPFALIPSGIQLLHQLDFHAAGMLQFGQWRASYDDATIIPVVAAFMGALVALPLQIQLEKRLEGKGLRVGGRADVAGYALAVMILALGRHAASVARAQSEAIAQVNKRNE